MEEKQLQNKQANKKTKTMEMFNVNTFAPLNSLCFGEKQDGLI